MIIKINRMIPSTRITEYEFNITKLFIDNFELDYDNDYHLYNGLRPIMLGDRFLSYSEHWDLLKFIPPTGVACSPLKHEKHANILIDMFDELNIIDMDSLEVKEFESNNKKKYCGYIKKNNKIVEDTYIKSAPSIPILKCSVIGKALFDEDDYDEFKNNLSCFLRGGKR